MVRGLLLLWGKLLGQGHRSTYLSFGKTIRSHIQKRREKKEREKKKGKKGKENKREMKK